MLASGGGSQWSQRLQRKRYHDSDSYTGCCEDFLFMLLKPNLGVRALNYTMQTKKTKHVARVRKSLQSCVCRLSGALSKKVEFRLLTNK